MYIPKLKETKTIHVAIETVLPYIDWVFFFKAWGISGRFEELEKFCGCEACRQAFLMHNRKFGLEKAKEALELYSCAIEMLKEVQKKKQLTIEAKVRFCKVRQQDEGILVMPDNGETVYLPTLRQQHIGERMKFCVSMCDFISPVEDYMGFFCLTVHGADEIAENFKKIGDVYRSILIKSLGDRLAEATSEWLHQQVRKIYWGYAPDEDFTPQELFKVPYQGIRPAIGYPSMPDLSMLFRVDKIIDTQTIGINITENGAMRPNASICGMYVSHPKSYYFMVGNIGDDQLKDYAERCGSTPDAIKRWLHNTKE